MFFFVGFLILTAVFFIGFVLKTACDFAEIENTTYLKCIGISLLTAIVSILATLIFQFGFVIGALISIWIIKYALETEWGKAIYAWIIYFVIQILLAFGLIFIISYLNVAWSING